MAIIPFIDENPGAQQGMAIAKWSGLTGGDTGRPFAYSNLADKTVQVFGTIGAAITIEGSNDSRVDTDAGNAVWEVLTDNLGNPLSYAARGMNIIVEAPRWIRPNCAAGTTNATVIILSNKS